MNGIIIENNNNKEAIVLGDNGLFSKVRNKNYEIGQTISINENKKTVSKFVVGAASMAAAFAICTIGGLAYYTPTDYVSLDVNPSVEYSINMFDRILDVKAVNDHGKEILSSLDLNNMTIEDAVKETLDKLMSDGYLTDDPNGGVVITTSNDEFSEAEELAAELELEIQAYLDNHEGIVAHVEAEAVGLKRVQEARELGVTPGKLNLVEKLQKSTTGAFVTEKWLTMPVKDINKAIKENRELAKNKGKDIIEDSEQLKETTTNENQNKVEKVKEKLVNDNKVEDLDELEDDSQTNNRDESEKDSQVNNGNKSDDSEKKSKDNKSSNGNDKE